MPLYLAQFFIFLAETGLHHVGQAGLKLLTPSDPPTSASQGAGITGMNHCAWPYFSHSDSLCSDTSLWFEGVLPW